MTTEQLEQLMQAHKCIFDISKCVDGLYECEIYDPSADFTHESGIVGWGTGPSIVEAVYEALKSKMGKSYVKDECDRIINETGVDRLW